MTERKADDTFQITINARDLQELLAFTEVDEIAVQLEDQTEDRPELMGAALSLSLALHQFAEQNPAFDEE